MPLTEVQKEYQRRYRATNKERIQETQRRIYLEQRESRIKKSAEYYAANKERVSAREAAKRKEDPISAADKKYREKYGIGFSDAMAMFDAAGDRCQCCSEPVKRPRTGASKAEVGNIDHCHSTGKVRGVLCNNCNMALGLLKDKPELAVAYLERTQ